MKRRSLILFGIVAALALVVVIGVRSGRHSGESTIVHTIVVRYATLSTKLPENGVVQRPRAVTVPTLVAGNIRGLYVKPGDYVSAGQTLATIDNPSLQTAAESNAASYRSSVAGIEQAQVQQQNAQVTYDANVNTALSSLHEAQRVYDADVNLYKNQAIPRNQLDTDRAKLEQAQAQYNQAAQQKRIGAVSGYGQSSVQVAQAQAQQAAISSASAEQQLAYTRIAAPFSGIVENVATQANDPLTSLHAGDPVTAGQALFTLAQGSNYIVKAEVDEQDVINVHVGQRAAVTGQDFPGRTLTGRVVAISPVAIKSSDASSTARQVLTTVLLDRSPSFLKDGMTVDVDILTTDMHHVLTVPMSALVKEGGRTYVWVTRGGKAVRVPVRAGAANDTQTAILSGIAPGDKLIVDNFPLLRGGMTVSATASPSAPPTPAQ